MKRVSRLVILPDYQGIGLGTKLLNWLGQDLKNQGKRLSITTSAKNMIYALKKSPYWRLKKYHKLTRPGEYPGYKNVKCRYATRELQRQGATLASFFYK